MRTAVLLTLMVFLASGGKSQGLFDLNVGSFKTELRNNALRLAVDYSRKGMEQLHNKQINGDSSFIVFFPEFKSEDGSEDVFSSIVAKLTGFVGKFHVKYIDGSPTPDLQRTTHVFPFSIGAETDGDFAYINGIIEGGYFPWYWTPQSKVPRVLKHTQAGIFLQAGYKFKGDTSSLNIGGKADQSEEKEDRAIFRSKFSFLIDTKNLMRAGSGFGFGIIGGGDLWYDFINAAFYYKLEAKARLYLSRNYYFDLQYQKGSGAPNFNKGDQFGVNLGISF